MREFRRWQEATDGMPPSVHLTRFPEPDPGLVRPDLDAAVDFVRRAVTLGLAVRNAAGVRVRQPLARAVVQAPAPMLAWLPAFASDLADELNVETVEHAAVDGGEPAEPAGEASLRAATTGDVTVALDLALTEGLRRKGLVRQLVHQVQLLRKSAGLAVDDRIRLVVTAGAESRDAFEEHRAYICAETLALEILRLPRPLPSGAGATPTWMAVPLRIWPCTGPGAPSGSMAPLKMNFTVPPAPVRFSWHKTGCGLDSVPSLQ